MSRITVGSVLAAMLIAAAMPAAACVRVPNVADVDQAIASARLSHSAMSRVRALRNQLAEQVRRGEYLPASVTEGQAMTMMGLRFEDYGQVVRGGCNGRWVRR